MAAIRYTTDPLWPSLHGRNFVRLWVYGENLAGAISALTTLRPHAVIFDRAIWADEERAKGLRESAEALSSAGIRLGFHCNPSANARAKLPPGITPTLWQLDDEVAAHRAIMDSLLGEESLHLLYFDGAEAFGLDVEDHYYRPFAGVTRDFTATSTQDPTVSTLWGTRDALSQGTEGQVRFHPLEQAARMYATAYTQWCGTLDTCRRFGVPQPPGRKEWGVDVGWLRFWDATPMSAKHMDALFAIWRVYAALGPFGMTIQVTPATLRTLAEDPGVVETFNHWLRR